MTETKPNCADFIVAAARTIRMNPSNLKKDTKAGVSIGRLYAIASKMYSEEEFRQGLERLFREETIVAMWRVTHITTYNTASKVKESWGPVTPHIITSIPVDMPLEDRFRYRYINGKFMPKKDNPVEHDLIFDVLLYVKADGLPKRVTKLEEKTRGATADQIIATMQKVR